MVWGTFLVKNVQDQMGICLILGGSKPLPGWPIAPIAALEKSAPECPFECGGGGAKAKRAMPKCPQHEFEEGFPKMVG